VLWIAWDTDMRTPGENGSTELATVRMRARAGAEWAIKKLKGPRYPRALSYLLDLYRDVVRGLARDEEGKRVLTWVDIDAWCRRKRTNPAPHELDALFQIHEVMMHPRAYLPEAWA
jgi:hypothetical protein